MSNKNRCSILDSKHSISTHIVKKATENIKSGTINKMNALWIEASGCSGNIISYLDGNKPDIIYTLSNLINLKYQNSLMSTQGNFAFNNIIDTLDTEFILIVDGAVSVGENGLYNIVAYYEGNAITGKGLIEMIAPKAKYIIALGTCACSGGVSASSPNPTNCISLQEFLGKKVINLPGCPCHPDWLSGTLANIVLYGEPLLDEENRPIMFYSTTIHDLCPRRSFFDKGIFAKNLGDKECMFKLGCRGPVTRTDCSIRNWNERNNWPIGDNTPCIGCANRGFPDKMEPFIRY